MGYTNLKWYKIYWLISILFIQLLKLIDDPQPNYFFELGSFAFLETFGKIF